MQICFLSANWDNLPSAAIKEDCSKVDVALGDADGVSHTNEDNVVAGLGL